MSLVRFLYRIYKLRFVFTVTAAAMLAGLSLQLISTIPPKTVEARAPDNKPKPVYDSPNVVANGASMAAYEAGRFAVATERITTSAAQFAAAATVSGAKSAVSGVRAGAVATGHGIAAFGRTVGSGAATTARGVATVGRGVGSGIVFIVKVPGNAIEAVADTPMISTFIRPADHQTDVPIIDPNSPELQAALAAFPAGEKEEKKTTTKKPNQKDVKPQWPIHGRVTTEFGVEHWPFQPTHTGIDISDSQAPGITPVKPFRPGRVIETVHSSAGLGNHVIVDHGSGVTSVYAHLASISVKTGQEVNPKTTLGLEGTTGVSTGTHLHFEIRVNGQSANPRQFIGGNP